MKSTIIRRLSVALIAPALAVGTMAAAPSAQAAPNSYAYSAARWLDDQLTNGIIHNEQYDYDDYGLSLDVFFTLSGLDTRPAAADSIIDAIKPHVADYTTYGTSVFAGATGKVATAVQDAGEDPTGFGGVDLIAQLEGLVVAEGPGTGRAKDAFDPEEEGAGDYSNSIGQSFAVRALAVKKSSLSEDVTSYLLKQQCGDGSFREQEADSQCTTGSGSVDVTALALQALLTAKDEGQADLQDDIDDGVAYLLGVQATNGSFTGNDVANTNTTGLAAATLKLAGKDGAAGSAAAWIVGHQVTDALAEDTELAGELGAVAYDKSALNTGKTAGIVTETRDQWIRATAQAALGVQAQLPAKTLTVTRPSGYAQAGRRVVITASGLTPGEFASIGSSTARASSVGKVALSYTAPATSGIYNATVSGSRTNRTGRVAVKVLAAKKLSAKVKYSSITRNKTQTLTVSGLASGEPVKIGYGGKAIKSSHASAKGTYTYSFNVGSKRGRQPVSFVGAFDNRRGLTSFTVK